MKKILISFLFSSLATAVSAVTIAYDGFNYGTGAGVPGSNGGSGWSAGWQANGTDVGQIVSGNVTYGNVGYDGQSTGNRLSWTNGANGDGWSRQLSSARGGSDTTYVSFLMEYNRTVPTESFYIGLDTQIRNPRSWAATRFRFARNGVDTSQTNVQYFNGSTWVQLGSTLNVDTTNPTLVVMGLNAATDTLEMWLNPTNLGGTAPSADISVGSITIGGFDWINFAGEWNNWELDEVRMGTAYADVTPVPEPSTYAMILGVLTLGIGFITRKRRV